LDRIIGKPTVGFLPIFIKYISFPESCSMVSKYLDCS
jgi:hypothetical protein